MMTYVLSSRSRRLGAAIIDGAFTFALTILGEFLFGLTNFNVMELNSFETKSMMILTIWLLVVTALLNVIIPTYLFKGQTIGKKLLSIKVVKDTDEEVDSKTMWLRSVIYLLMQISLPVYDIILGIVSIVDILMIFSENRRTLHDRIAKTKVIDLRNPI
jgi:uncharacterized RDD family membrane protein YckC